MHISFPDDACTSMAWCEVASHGMDESSSFPQPMDISWLCMTSISTTLAETSSGSTQATTTSTCITARRRNRWMACSRICSRRDETASSISMTFRWMMSQTWFLHLRSVITAVLLNHCLHDFNKKFTQSFCYFASGRGTRYKVSWSAYLCVSLSVCLSNHVSQKPHG